MILNEDFKEFIALLNSNNVRYLVAGGYAVAVHGHPRYTKDIDVWIEATPENAKRLLQALDQFGFGSLGLSINDFIEPDQIIQLGYPPNRIDLLTSLSGVEFSSCFTNCIHADIGGTEAAFISLQDLRQNKQASGRPQDLADLDNLK